MWSTLVWRWRETSSSRPSSSVFGMWTDTQRSFETSGWRLSPIVFVSVISGLIPRWHVEHMLPEQEEKKKNTHWLWLRWSEGNSEDYKSQKMQPSCSVRTETGTCCTSDELWHHWGRSHKHTWTCQHYRSICLMSQVCYQGCPWYSDIGRRTMSGGWRDKRFNDLHGCLGFIKALLMNNARLVLYFWQNVLD